MQITIKHVVIETTLIAALLVTTYVMTGCAHVPKAPYTCTTDAECYNECITLHTQKDCE